MAVSKNAEFRKQQQAEYFQRRHQSPRPVHNGVEAIFNNSVADVLKSSFESQSYAAFSQETPLPAKPLPPASPFSEDDDLLESSDVAHASSSSSAPPSSAAALYSTPGSAVRAPLPFNAVQQRFLDKYLLVSFLSPSAPARHADASPLPPTHDLTCIVVCALSRPNRRLWRSPPLRNSMTSTKNFPDPLLRPLPGPQMLTAIF